MSVTELDLVDKGLPRRLSVIPSTRDYDPKAQRLCDRIAVFLDGAELPEVAIWDVDDGTVVRRRRHEDGRLVLDAKGQPTYETLNGRVEVRWSKGSAA